MVDSGHIKPGYIDSMLGREKVANTFLGNGIAIPHGLPKDRELILKTGIAVMQVPAGVEWNPGETVYLVVGIAARSDEHIEILTNLTHVLDDEKLVQRLSTTENAEDIFACLTGPRDASRAAASPAAALADFADFIDVTVQGPTACMPGRQRLLWIWPNSSTPPSTCATRIASPTAKALYPS